MKKLLSLLMAVAFVFTSANGTITAFAESAKQDIERTELTFPEMENKHYDTKKLYSFLEDIQNECKKDDNEDKVLDLYNKIYSELDNISTAQTINSIYYNKNVEDERYADENEYYANACIEATDKSFVALKEVLNSQYGKALQKKIGKDLANVIKEYSEMSEEDFEQSQKEQALIQQYEQACVKDYVAEVNGEFWSTQKLREKEAELDYGEYNEIARAIAKKKNSVLGEIFVELVKLRDGEAKKQDYDNYADYAYEVMYSREYTTDDIKKVHSAVKKYFVPLYYSIIEKVSDSDYESAQSVKGYSGEEVLDKIGKHMKDILPELEYSFKFMREHKLYDIESEVGKMNTGYTCYLSSYNVPFIYNSPYNTYNDFKDMVHEFGHFNNAFYNESHVLETSFESLDVNEIQSQALELLFLEYSQDIYGNDTADSVKYFSILDMLQAIIQGCCYDEFQQEVYANPDMTLQEMNKCFKEISESYGNYYDDGIEEDYTWVEVGHTYLQPMYYISYATSGLSSFDIWTLSLKDREKGIEAYKTISLDSYNMSYKDAIKQCGLRDIFRQNKVASIAKDVAEYLEVDTEQFETVTDYTVFSIVIIASLIAVMIVIIVMMLSNRKKIKDINSEKNREREHNLV